MDTLVASSSNNVLRNGYEKVKIMQLLSAVVATPPVLHGSSTGSGFADAFCMIQTALSLEELEMK